MKPVVILLTCANQNEAKLISQTLLDKKLVVCIKKTNVSSSFLFEHHEDNAKEVLLIMESVENNFDKIEKEVRKVHSYSAFVLLAIPVIKTTKKVERWMKDEIVS